ncbi:MULTISPECIES: cardiolipin synthase [unclassified Microbacterium]|uniref:cardiolipin synthase n=1 Tax=unclassified Microbacterium TaxID=2609290 RepID=UPI00214B3DA3|nr:MULTISPECIES: cardiolipin synthase [unclassified Microbacterium]MCR2784738.1 cardiolipin synthase [Microbacterium sp. zg.B96]MDL5352807.1 cardiolipin synthase [Microbacterium sp. zg-YB36]WIM16277.1 cardiolipin synthase [Microbacterium sp. zg-B96]
MISITFDWTWWVILAFVVDIIVRITAIIVIPRNRRPTAAMAWLLAIYFIPFVGVFLFLLIGNPRLPRKRRRKQDQINAYIHETSEHLDFGTLRPHAPEWFTSTVTLNRNLGAMPLAGDNSAHLIADYRTALDEQADAIRAAERYVHVEFYILQTDATTDNFFRALEEVCARGVTVRVLMDHWANRGKPFYKQTLRRLTAMGAHWELMLPVQPFKGKYQRPDLRNHRKLLVVDGRVAYMGSQNITDSTYNLRRNIRRGLRWVDLMMRVEGPVVASINAVFLSDWFSETDEILTDEIDLFSVQSAPGDLDCQIIPSGPGFEFENNLKLFLSLMYAAQRKLIIVSPYFVPDESMLLAITTACQRGVDVQLFVSEEGDQAIVYHAQRSYYEALLRAGVRIWMYRKPYILHSKSMTVDDEVGVIGSSNMDMRSFGLNLEVSMLVRGEEYVREMRDVEQMYRELSRELTLEEWEQQPLRSTVLDNLARLTSALQ